MKVFTVCRMNQARSPLAAAVLQANFPEHDFLSTGVWAISGTPILKEVQAVAKEWGLEHIKKKSNSIRELLPELLEADLVIVAEDVHSQVIRDFGYKGDIVSCESLLPDQMFAPKDPEGMVLDKARRELGKVAGLSLRAMLGHLDIHSPNKLISVTPNGSSDLALAVQTAHLEAKNRHAILLDADLRAPLEDSDLKEFGLQPVFFDIETIFEAGLPNLGENEILVHSRQLNHPERLYLSAKWRHFLDLCCEKNDLVMVTAPRYAKTRSLPDSFVVAALADEFMVISS
jgi:protein-tyrosine-phosphatase